MIEVKIRTADYNKYKDPVYMRELSYPRNWYYPTENELIIIYKTIGYASMMISKDKEEYDALIKTIKEEKVFYDNRANNSYK